MASISSSDFLFLNPSQINLFSPSEKDWKTFFEELEKLCPNSPVKKELYTSLQVAAFLGQTKVCLQLIADGHNPDDSGKVGLPPLYLALRNQQLETALILIEGNANIHATYREKDLEPPLWYAIICFKWHQGLQYCFDHHLLNDNRSFCGLSPLGWSLAAKNFFAVEICIKAGASLDNICKDEDKFVARCKLMDPNFKQKEDTTYIVDAWSYCMVVCPEHFERLLNLTEILAKSFKNYKGESLLHLAVNSGVNAAVNLLLKRKFKANVMDHMFYTPYLKAKGFCYQNLTPLEEGTIKALKDSDQRYSKIAKKAILFGNRLSLNEKRFEGYYTHKMFYKHLVRLLSDWFKKNPMDKSDELIEALSSAIALTKEEAEKRVKENKMVVVPSGWYRHAVGFVYTSHAVYTINLGEKASPIPGINVYYFEKKPSIETIVQVISTLIENKKSTVEKKEEAIQFFNHEMIKRLNLIRFANLEQEQDSGNCPWASTLYTACALLLDQKLENKTAYTLEDGQAALNSIAETFKDWLDYDLEDAVLQFEYYLQELFSPDEVAKIYQDMLLSSLKNKSFSLLYHVIEKNPDLANWKHPLTKKSLIHCVFEKKMWVAFSYLSEKNIEPSLKDPEFIEEIHKNPLWI